MNVWAVSAVLMSALVSSASTALSPNETTSAELRRELLPGERPQPDDPVRLLPGTDVVAVEIREVSMRDEQQFTPLAVER